MSEDLSEFLRPGPTVESDHAAVTALARRVVGNLNDPKAKAIKLYYAVRDGIRYFPSARALSVEGYRASVTLAEGQGYCVAKAVVLAAVCRAAGVPARLGFADVRNHISTAKMRERMGSDIFYWHGYTSIHLKGKWVKSTPAFNIELCEKFGIKALDFDGETDSIFHPFDTAGNRHMEYLEFRGEFAEVPIDQLRETYIAEYDHWKTGERGRGGNRQPQLTAAAFDRLERRP